MKATKPPLIVIVGPTASGKSDLAMRVAQQYGGELICADSRTVYRGMDIGTAKPNLHDRAILPHHLLGIVEPGQPFTAADFKRLANVAITDITKRGKLPIMVGGTGLYIDAILFDYQFGKPADLEYRARLQHMNIYELQQICRDKNIELPFNESNKRHLVRAIELGGLPKGNGSIRQNTLVVGMATDRDVLRKRIIDRAQHMVSQGVVDEVQSLGQKYGWENEAMTGNIYRIFRGVIVGKVSLEEALEQVVRSDMSLAKRQMTWFKRNPQIIWGTPDGLKERIAGFIAVVKR